MNFNESKSFYTTRPLQKIFELDVLHIKLVKTQISKYIGFTPMTRDELKTAVDFWCDDEEEALKKYGHISNWNVQNITDMTDMFNGCENFNQPLNNWDVSNVTNMSYMFGNCKKFNQPLNNWDVSNVTNMRSMFCYCYKFNQPLNNWSVNKVHNLDTKCQRDVSNVTQRVKRTSRSTNMCGMFCNCKMKNPFI